MPRFLSILAASLFVLAGAASTVQAYHPPLKVDFGIRLDVELTNRPQYKNLAPWYSYFPYDPHVHGRAPHFPNWPQTWPPTGPAPRKEMTLPPVPPIEPGPAPTPLNYRPGYAPVRPVSHAQPAGYFQAPSYWYGR